MNGYDIYKKAILRLGHSNFDSNSALSDTRVLTAKEFINQILMDLKLEGIDNMSSELKCNTAELEALCCGVAMLLSLSEGDAEKNQMFTALYNAKRASVLSETILIEDTLPKAENGGT